MIERRGRRWLWIEGRLADGLSMGAAGVQLDTIMSASLPRIRNPTRTDRSRFSRQTMSEFIRRATEPFPR
jgi:hypothetical protein